jgi:hypothetical protein
MGHSRENTEEAGDVDRAKSLCDGVYVNRAIEGVPRMFTVDSGASKTIVSTKIYERIDQSKRPSLQKNVCLKGASGSPIKEKGKAEFNIELGQYEIISVAVVAEIEVDALLGFDVLIGRKKGPADITLSKNKIILDGIEIPTIQIGKTQRD